MANHGLELAGATGSEDLMDRRRPAVSGYRKGVRLRHLFEQGFIAWQAKGVLMFGGFYNVAQVDGARQRVVGRRPFSARRVLDCLLIVVG